MFWKKLTEQENVRYRELSFKITPWLAWASLSKTKRPLVIEPYKPSDQELMEVEFIAMKGWGMIDAQRFKELTCNFQ